MAPEKSPLSSKEKILKIKREILKIVEDLLQENISEEFLLEKCNKLCQADYDDVVQERSIDYMCGYPICNKPIKEMKQQYQIKRNKIYDISERKKFCSNECYKASNFLKAQLQTLPLYMRKSEASSSKFKLLCDSDNKGSAGEELVFKHSISEKDIETNYTPPVVSTDLNSMLQEDIKDCTEHVTNLEIKEKVFKKKYAFGEEVSNMLSGNACIESTSESSDSDSSENDDKTLFPDYDNIKVLSNKYMPVPEKAKKVVLIDPLKPTKISTPSPAVTLPIDFFVKVFEDWFTEDTMKFLLGEKHVFTIKADSLFKEMVNSNEPHDRLSSIKDKYINLCMKIDKLPDEEEVDDSTNIDLCDQKPAKKYEIKQGLEKLALEMDSLQVSPKPDFKPKTKKKSQKKKKSVSFKSDSMTDKNKSVERNVSEDMAAKSLPDLVSPLVDSLSQNTLRKQVLMSKLKNVYINLLPVIDKHYREIKEEIKVIVDTFSLTPTNIVYKPKQFNCIATVLFRILTHTRLKELHNDDEFSKLCENSLASQNISKQEIENLVLDLISANQVLKLPKLN